MKINIKHRLMVFAMALIATIGLAGVVIAIQYPPKARTTDVAATTATPVATTPITPQATISVAATPTVPIERTTSTSSNTAKCNQLVADQRTKLLAISAQIDTQLAIMKQIADYQQPSSIHQSTQEQIMSQAQRQANFDAAQKQADQLTAQYGTVRTSYHNQLFAAQCSDQIKAQKWPLR